MPIRIELLDFEDRGYGAFLEIDLEKRKGFPQEMGLHHTSYADKLGIVADRVSNYLKGVNGKGTIKFDQIYGGMISGVSPKVDIDFANLLEKRGHEVYWGNLLVEESPRKIRVVGS